MTVAYYPPMEDDSPGPRLRVLRNNGPSPRCASRPVRTSGR